MQNSTIQDYFFYTVFGVAMGVTLSLGGFADFEQVNSLFLLQDITLLLVFAGAVSLCMLGFVTLCRKRKIAKKTYNGGTIPGSIMFGIGWAMTGACPSIALVQLGEGKLGALVTIFGIVTGVWVYRTIAAPSFQLDTGVCGE
ncbi:MAG: hypothetical protein DRR11_09360 [Gammaproteobacteria bacterium]|nr:MAG: hypothetical protein DRR15_15970 [Gammaproteobacteria bacterium]RLA32009.1 MAG: hypothetical protein DRR11_09360 [Gammaproteobacteria bacterium]